MPSQQEKRTRSLKLTSAQLSPQRAFKFNGSGDILVKKCSREDLRSTDKQPDKSRSEGMPDVNRRAIHVDAIKLDGGCNKPTPRIHLIAAGGRELKTVGMPWKSRPWLKRSPLQAFNVIDHFKAFSNCQTSRDGHLWSPNSKGRIFPR